MNWFEIRVIYERTIENGQTAKVKEDYMFEAETVAEAERKAVDYLGPEIKGEFEVDSVKKRKIAEMFEDPMTAGEKWYKAKVNFITIDEKTAQEKKQGATMMIYAADFHGALRGLDDGMTGTMSDWEIASIAETSIVEVIKQVAETEE